jgi:hypothetical protein
MVSWWLFSSCVPAVVDARRKKPRPIFERCVLVDFEGKPNKVNVWDIDCLETTFQKTYNQVSQNGKIVSSQVTSSVISRGINWHFALEFTIKGSCQGDSCPII